MSLPVGLVARVARRAVKDTLSVVDDKVVVVGQVHLGAQVQGDAAPALVLVGASGAVGHTAALVVVVQAGRAGHVVARLRAAAQALAVATLPAVGAGQPAVGRADWRRQRRRGRSG